MKAELKAKIEKIEYVYENDSIACLITTKCGFVFCGECFEKDGVDELDEKVSYNRAIAKFTMAEAYLRKNLSNFCDTFGANTEIPEPISGGVIM